jgi:hypothetical protein
MGRCGGVVRNTPSGQSAPPGGKGLRVNAVQAERWTKSKSLRELFSKSCTSPSSEGGLQAKSFYFVVAERAPSLMSPFPSILQLMISRAETRKLQT